MSYRLPEQEATDGTYMAISTIAWYIKNRLVPGRPEGETSRVWNTILNHLFKPEDGYTTGPEMSFGPGRADLFTAHLVLDVRFTEKKFLIVECKKPGDESQDSTWSEAKGQLQDYLGNITSKNRKFGAIAIGKVVRFFEMTGSGLVAFEGDDKYYYIDRQCQSVTRKLLYFRENHA
ncbi:hypothetical protein B0I35DRAFT_458164 [Stachybotrys elegans]|uniref:Uncharacterized protein n=1 Tax=Stachybotrys elegans TaxID=80388 RepID=A0A8K0SWZ3_9HYPO|nr:hypothetical protein B0I35DRAFT_458164 [Stachybotrys elegans]